MSVQTRKQGWTFGQTGTVYGGDPVAFRTLMVPLDGSDLAERVLNYAEHLARPTHAEVVLLRVTATPSPLAWADPAAPAVAMAPTADEIAQDAERYLQAAAERVAARGIRVRPLVVGGEASSEIIRQAGVLGADLIAMTTHGRGGIERALFGSVADAVVRAAPCPIFLLPLRDGEEG